MPSFNSQMKSIKAPRTIDCEYYYYINELTRSSECFMAHNNKTYSIIGVEVQTVTDGPKRSSANTILTNVTNTNI